MYTVYYHSISSMYVLFYIILYFQAKKFTGKIVYVIEPVRILLGRSNRKNRIPLIIVIGHILNTISLLIGIFGHNFINGRTAFQIYKYSIPVFWVILVITEEITEKDDSLK